MTQNNYSYLVDSKGLTPKERGELEDFLHRISFVCAVKPRNKSFNEPPFYLVHTTSTPDEFANLPFPCECSWQNVTGYDLTQL